MNTSANWFESDDLIDNPSARIPVTLCLDVSSSMGGQPIAELNAGVRRFLDAVRNDEAARYAAEIGIVAFGSDVKTVAEFARPEPTYPVPTLKAFGYTHLGEGVNASLDLLENRKALYRKRGVDYYQPWLVLMTDGMPNGSEAELQRAIQRTQQLTGTRRLTVLPIGIGPDADLRTLAQFSANGRPLRMQGLRFGEFFTWLSQSVAGVSRSIPGETFDFGPIDSWASL